MSKNSQIAIDGPVAAGKSTIARELATKLNYVYVDTGAMYRAVTYVAMQQGIDLENEESLVAMIRSIDLDIRTPEDNEKDGRLSTVLIDGEDVSWKIRSSEISSNVAGVASLPRVREVLVPKQRKIAGGKNVVMEGRDITYVVLPDADLKIFLTADEDVRMERYFEMLKSKDKDVTTEQAGLILQQRDKLDTTRETSPLRIVSGAWVLDTTELSVDEVVDVIIERVNNLE